MPQLHESHAALRIVGDALIPDDVSKLLGATPTNSRVKGETWIGKSSGREYVAKSGAWHLSAEDCKPGDLDKQAADLLGKMTSDLDVWRELTGKFKVDLFCGWFMEDSNEGLSVSPRTMAALAERGIKLDIGLYAPSLAGDVEHQVGHQS
jgi:hypothetical protein